LQALSSLETLLQSALTAAALAAALWSARSAIARTRTPATGELAWSVVAAGVLLAAGLAVRFGSFHGI
jgi:hypothetical protein